MKNILYIIILSFMFSSAYAGMTEHINKGEEAQKKEKPIIDLNPIPDKAKIVFIRESRFVGSALGARIKIDGVDVKKVGSGVAYVHAMEEGSHIISCTAFMTPGQHKIEINIKKNNTYFIKIAPRGSGVLAGAAFGAIGMAMEGGGFFSLAPLSIRLAKDSLDELGYKYNDNELVEKSEDNKRELNKPVTKEPIPEPIEKIKNTTSSEAMKLRELHQLYKEGVLTEEEFNLKKKELLDKM